MMAVIFEAALRSGTLACLVWLLLKALRSRDLKTEKAVWTFLLLATYCAASGVLLLRFLGSLAVAQRMLRRARPLGGVPAGIDARCSGEIRTPCTLGSVILLRESFPTWTPEKCASALAHEREHVAQLDCYRLWLATLHCCFFWFSPGPWLLRRRLTLLAEHTSDQTALRGSADSAGYARFLVELAADERPSSAMLAMSARGDLATRIDFIMENAMKNTNLSQGKKLTMGVASLSALQHVLPVRPDLTCCPMQKIPKCCG